MRKRIMTAYRQPENIAQSGFRMWIESLAERGDLQTAEGLLIEKCTLYPNQSIGAFALVASSSNPEVRAMVSENMMFLLDRDEASEFFMKAAYRIMGRLCRDEVPYVANVAQRVLSS
jgi:hypothetical protein